MLAMCVIVCVRDCTASGLQAELGLSLRILTSRLRQCQLYEPTLIFHIPLLSVRDENSCYRNATATKEKSSKGQSRNEFSGQGDARGNRTALYGRAMFQRSLYHLGSFVEAWPKTVLYLGLLVLTLCCGGILREIVNGFTIETDLVKLWVEQNGRLNDELNFLNNAKANYSSTRRKRSTEPIQPINAQVIKHGPLPPADVRPELPTDNGFNSGFQVVIQTPEIGGSDILSKEGLLRHVNILEEIAQYDVEMFGEHWRLADICFKPPAPKFPKSSIAATFQSHFDNLIPCIWITPADCFWEGSKPLGPFPPIILPPILQDIPTNLSWKNLDPVKLIKAAETFLDKGPMEGIKDVFERAGVGHAYQDRICIDPLDVDCPSTAPNYFDRCAAFKRFVKWNNNNPESQQVKLEAEQKKDPLDLLDLSQFIGRRKKRQEALSNAPPSPALNTQKSSHAKGEAGKEKNDDGDYYDDSTVDDVKPSDTPERKEEKKFKETCEIYANSFLNWMKEVGPNNWDFLNYTDDVDREVLMPPIYPDYGNLLTGGCEGFGRNIMKWPEDLIVGGVKRSNGFINRIEAFQSVFLVASHLDVYNRFKNKDPSIKPALDVNAFSPAHAGAIVQKWQREFTSRIYDHPLNHKGKGERVFHPLTADSIQEILKEFSDFQLSTILIGYVLMIIYAGYTQVEWDGWWFSVKSSCYLAIIGVLIVTYSSLAGLGLCTLMGIHFNAATTQIVPFLTLGLGIDDMFLLLHNYDGVLESVKRDEVAVLIKETGMSILITSINNILAFLTGTILPIPALRSFCSQVAVLLFFNVVCIIIIYPACIALDLKRRKAGIRDMTFGCLCSASEPLKPEKGSARQEKESSSRNQLVKSVSASSELGFQEMVAFPNSHAKPVDHKVSKSDSAAKWYTLTGFLHGVYIPLLMKPWAKMVILLTCSFMFLFGCVGLYNSDIGLELSDVLPENTPPSAFLKAREKYFSFYPFHIALKGPHIDYPNQQDQIVQLRLDIGKSKFVIKGDSIERRIQEPSELPWTRYMFNWLKSLQKALDKEIASGNLDPKTGANKTEITDQALFAKRLLCSYGTIYNCTGRLAMRLVENDKNHIIRADGFYNYLTAWYNTDSMMYYVSQAAFFPAPPGWAFDKHISALVPPAEPLIYSQIPFFLTGLTDTPVIVEMIREIRKICEEYSDNGLPVFPIGIPFTFWEQYLHLTIHLFEAIVIIAIAVLAVISVIIFNPWAAAMVAIIVVSMTVELAGFMGLFGVKLNPISAVTLITAVGIGVEFTAHVVLAFLTSLGTRNERMASCLEHMFIPVIHGGLSTLLGIIMLAFSKFDFIVKYFFVVMTALVIIGMFNGLAMLPVMLSLIGPPCEVVPIDGGRVLPCPPSKRRRSKRSSKNEELGGMTAGGQSPSPATSESSDDGTHLKETHSFHNSLSTLGEEDSTTRSAASPIVVVTEDLSKSDDIQRYAQVLYTSSNYANRDANSKHICRATRTKRRPKAYYWQSRSFQKWISCSRNWKHQRHETPPVHKEKDKTSPEETTAGTPPEDKDFEC
ncbi:patched family domain-containing protein [Ditylenchus destructor]|uniref:Patched family domain-containing protein n=1 Tax=Ditylenchus destructor TaxID=166010 RepID=A0AAD4R3J9_9BILA|nr:patched family domain-containing protein [Ditylenchus destructor]